MEIVGTGTAGSTGIDYSNFTADHCDFSGTDDGIKPGGNCTVTNNYVHDLYRLSGTSHNDCIQVGSGSNVLIQHNYLRNDYNETSAVHIATDQGPISDITVDSNFMEGGGYTIYGGGNNGKFGVATAITIKTTRSARTSTRPAARAGRRSTCATTPRVRTPVTTSRTGLLHERLRPNAGRAMTFAVRSTVVKMTVEHPPARLPAPRRSPRVDSVIGQPVMSLSLISVGQRTLR